MSRTLALYSERLGSEDGLPISANISATSLAEVHRQLGQRYFQNEQYRLARRHFRIARQFEPKSAELAFELARCWEDDPQGSDERALALYRHAVRLNGKNSRYFAALGRSAIRNSNDKQAKKALARAARLSPADAVVIAIVLEAMREAGWHHRAWTIACRARFLAPADAAIRQLWNRVRFDLASTQIRKPLQNVGRKTIPFLRIACGDENSKWRYDAI